MLRRSVDILRVWHVQYSVHRWLYIYIYSGVYRGCRLLVYKYRVHSTQQTDYTAYCYHNYHYYFPYLTLIDLYHFSHQQTTRNVRKVHGPDFRTFLFLANVWFDSLLRTIMSLVELDTYSWSSIYYYQLSLVQSPPSFSILHTRGANARLIRVFLPIVDIASKESVSFQPWKNPHRRPDKER